MIVVTPSGDTNNVDPTTPGATEVFRASYLVTLAGVDGSVWDLNNGPVCVVAGVKLFGMPAVTHWLKTSPTVDGSRWTGMRTEARDVLLPVTVQGADWADYRDVDTRFFRAIAPEGEAVLTVTAPDAVSRSLLVRLTGDGDLEDDFDPLLFARKTYSLEFVAADPYWHGDTVTYAYSAATPVPFLAPPGPPIFLNSGRAADRASIPNPGDVPAWPRYTITGPVDTFSVGIGTSVVRSTAPIGAGSQVIIDSAPWKASIVDQDGTRIYEQMDEVTFRPVPPGAEVPIKLALTGQGDGTNVQVSLTPLYRRPL